MNSIQLYLCVNTITSIRKTSINRSILLYLILLKLNKTYEKEEKRQRTDTYIGHCNKKIINTFKNDYQT